MKRAGVEEESPLPGLDVALWFGVHRGVVQEFHQTRPYPHGDTHYNALAKQGIITITTQLTFVFCLLQGITQSSSLGF